MHDNDETPARAGASGEQSGDKISETKGINPLSESALHASRCTDPTPMDDATEALAAPHCNLVQLIGSLVKDGYSLEDIALVVRRSRVPSTEFVDALGALGIRGTVRGAAIKHFLSTMPPTTSEFSWVTVPLDRPRSQITITPDLRSMSEQAWAALDRANDPPFLFRFGKLIAWIETDPVRELRVLHASHVRHLLTWIIRWLTRGRGGQNRLVGSAPNEVVADLMATPNLALPALNRLVTVPVFGSDGSLEIEPGYHAATGTFYFPEPGFTLPQVLRHPTRYEISRARNLIFYELLGDFPFVGDAERAHAMAAVLLPFCRSLIDGPTPLHLIEKPTPGTGATLLASDATISRDLKAIFPGAIQCPACACRHPLERWKELERQGRVKLGPGPSEDEGSPPGRHEDGDGDGDEQCPVDPPRSSDSRDDRLRRLKELTDEMREMNAHG